MKIVVVGAGAAGIAMGIRLKQAGLDDFVIVDRSEAVGGTWYHNRYPGAACDVPSHLYCFSFAPNDWQHKFARQPEIERYLARLVAEHGLRPHLRLGTEVQGARFEDGTWRIRTSAGELLANVLIAGTGQLDRPVIPALPGLERFAGRMFHSARWDTSYEVRGKRIAVIGTGASAVQIVPELAREAAHLTVLQRSPTYVIARGDRAYRSWERWALRRVPRVRRLYRGWIYGALEARFTGLRRGTAMATLMRWVAMRHLHAQVTDPALRAALTPSDPPGCKRVVLSDDWYPALARDNVALVTSAIERIVPEGVVTADGATHAVDALVFATGFDTTHFLAPMEIVGRDDVRLADAWRDGAEAHHGIVVSGFPNLFLLYGPNTNLGHNSILFMIECQVRYVLRCLQALERRGARWLDVRPEAMARSNAALQAALALTAWAAGCHSWYKTADGKVTNNWSGRATEYWRRTRTPELADFVLG